MKTVAFIFLLFIVSCNAKFEMDTYVDEFINIDAKGYYLKILTPESNAENVEYFFGKIVVIPGCSFAGNAEERVINCYLLDADNYEEWKSGKDPSKSIFKKIEKSNITIPITKLDWEENEKYYFIVSNRFSGMGKTVQVYLVRIY